MNIKIPIKHVVTSKFITNVYYTANDNMYSHPHKSERNKVCLTFHIHFTFSHSLRFNLHSSKSDIDLSSFDGDPVLVPKSLFGVFPLVYIYYHTAHNKMKYNDSIIIIEIFLGLSKSFVYKYMYPSLETCILNGNEISSI